MALKREKVEKIRLEYDRIKAQELAILVDKLVKNVDTNHMKELSEREDDIISELVEDLTWNEVDEE